MWPRTGIVQRAGGCTRSPVGLAIPRPLQGPGGDCFRFLASSQSRADGAVARGGSSTRRGLAGLAAMDRAHWIRAGTCGANRSWRRRDYRDFSARYSPVRRSAGIRSHSGPHLRAKRFERSADPDISPGRHFVVSFAHFHGRRREGPLARRRLDLARRAISTEARARRAAGTGAGIMDTGHDGGWHLRALQRDEGGQRQLHGRNSGTLGTSRPAVTGTCDLSRPSRRVASVTRATACVVLTLASGSLVYGSQGKPVQLGCGSGWQEYVERKALELKSRGVLGFGFDIVVQPGGELPSPRLVVLAVAAESPADNAGLKVGDLVVSVKGTLPAELDPGDLARSQELVDELFSSIHPGEEVPVQVYRDGRRFSIVVMAAKPGEREIGAWLAWHVDRYCGEEALHAFLQRGRS